MKTMKYLTILLTVFLVKSCGNTKSMAMEDQNNTTLNGEYTVTTLEENSKTPSTVVLKFDDTTKRVSGNSGCNSFFGNYKTDGKTITFENIATTKMLCDDEKNKTEQNVLNVFKKADAFSIDGNKLSLLQGKTNLLSAKHSSPKEMRIQNDISLLSYSAYSRGSSYDIKITPKTITYKKNRKEKEATTKPCSKEDWNTLMSLIDTINVNMIPELEAPSKAHQYDGAPIANFSVIKSSETYAAKAFDAGKPNKKIAAIIEKMISLTEK